jgi:hypothetical protein
MKVIFNKKLTSAVEYIFIQGSTDVELQELGESDWQKLNAVFDSLKDLRINDSRKGGYGVLKVANNNGILSISFVQAEDYKMPQKVKQALTATKKNVSSLQPNILTEAPVLQAIIEGAFNILPISNANNVYITVGLLRYFQSGEGLGAHRDGADYVTTHLIARSDVEGAESTFYIGTSDTNPKICLLSHRLDSIAFDDIKIWHGVQPVKLTSPNGHRDIIVLGFHKSN